MGLKRAAGEVVESSASFFTFGLIIFKASSDSEKLHALLLPIDSFLMLFLVDE
jgi:hypothetical protein